MYSKEEISKIKLLINDHFQRGDVYDKLKQRIETQGLTLENLDNTTLSNILKDTNLLDNLVLDVKHIDEINEFQQKNVQKNTFINIDKVNYKSVSLRIYKGKGFFDFLHQEPNEPKFLQLFLSFCGQRYCSQQVAATMEPDFNELFVFDLRTEAVKANVELLQLSKLEHPIELSLVLIDDKNQIRKLYSQKLIEWRFLLCYGNISLNIELPYTHEQKQSLIQDNPLGKQVVGILQVNMDFLPKSGIVLLPESVLTTQLSKEKSLLQQIVDRYHTYTSAWWNDYKELRLPVRPVKLYAESQDGVWRPTCSFVCELVGVRGIPTPNHAARFVSLIPFQRQAKGPQGSERTEIWHKFSTFLSIRNGDYEDHCLLLCSLLLGFNIEAFVVIGTSSDGAHGWVLTRQVKGKLTQNTKKKQEYVIHFWESLTGHKFELNDPRVTQMYKKIGCIYNNKHFFANIQSNDTIGSTDLNFEDHTKWKAIDPIEIQNLRTLNQQIQLLPPTLQPHLIEPEIEQKLIDSLTNYRRILQLATRFDLKLGGIMQMALANYETEKITGVTFCQQEFQSALKSYIPEGHIFKAFPIQFTHMDTNRMIEALKQAPLGGEIISARGDQAFFSLKVKLEFYAEDVYAIWVVIAVRYHHIN